MTLPGRGYRFAATVRTVTRAKAKPWWPRARTRTLVVIEENESESDQSLKALPTQKTHKKLAGNSCSPWQLWLCCWRSAHSFSFEIAGVRKSPTTKSGSSLPFHRFCRLSRAVPGRVYARVHRRKRLIYRSRTDLRQVASKWRAGPAYRRRCRETGPLRSLPDGSHIVYSIIEPWDTWEVSALGGGPHLLLPNSSSLKPGSSKGSGCSFSEMREGLQLVLVTTDENRGNSRDVYVPFDLDMRASCSYLSPDGRVDCSWLRWTVKARLCPASHCSISGREKGRQNYRPSQWRMPLWIVVARW